MGDGGDPDGGLRRLVAGEIAGELRERAFHHVFRRIELQITLDHDFGARRHVQIDGLAFDQFDRRAANRAHDVVFAHALLHRRAAGEAERRLPADRHRDRHFIVPGALPRSGVLADMLGAPHQDGDFGLARHHAAVDADIHDAGVVVLGDAAPVGEEIAPAVEPVPPRRRKFVEIDGVAEDDILLHRAGGDDFRRNAAREHVAAELDQIARMGVGRAAQHHGDAAVTRQPAAEDPSAARIRSVILDGVEQQRRPVAGALGEPHHGADLDVPIDLRIDLADFAGRAEGVDPAAKIPIGDRIAFDCHCVFLESALPALRWAGVMPAWSRHFNGERVRRVEFERGVPPGGFSPVDRKALNFRWRRKTRCGRARPVQGYCCRDKLTVRLPGIRAAMVTDRREAQRCCIGSLARLFWAGSPLR